MKILSKRAKKYALGEDNNYDLSTRIILSILKTRTTVPLNENGRDKKKNLEIYK
jgi:hypothetical protein